MSLFSRIPINKTQIENAIAELEQNSSAELRVFVERNMPKAVTTAFERACQVFEELDMYETKHRNAVLIYVAFKAHQCYVLGDQGIHQFVGEQFWQDVSSKMIACFKQDEFTRGIVQAIEQIGKKLVVHFPIQDDDVNELPNEVVIND